MRIKILYVGIWAATVQRLDIIPAKSWHVKEYKCQFPLFPKGGGKSMFETTWFRESTV